MSEGERRRAYRQPGPGFAGLALRVQRADGSGMGGRVVDVSAGGVAVQVESSEPPPPGEPVDVAIAAPGGEQTRLRAEVLSPSPSGRGWRFGLRFIDPPAAGEVDTDGFYRTFNRRGAYRVAVGDDDGVSLRLGLPGDDGAVADCGAARVSNLSATGAGIMTGDLGVRLVAGARLHLSLSLPDVDAPFAVAAVVRNCQPHGGGFYVGVEFDLAATDNALDMTEDIVAFVLERLGQSRSA